MGFIVCTFNLSLFPSCDMVILHVSYKNLPIVLFHFPCLGFYAIAGILFTYTYVINFTVHCYYLNSYLFFFFLIIKKCVSFWLCRALIAVWAFLWLWSSSFSLWWLLLWQSTGSVALGLQQSQHMGTSVAAPGL